MFLSTQKSLLNLFLSAIFIYPLFAFGQNTEDSQPEVSTDDASSPIGVAEPSDQFILATSSGIDLVPESMVKIGDGYNSIQGVFRASPLGEGGEISMVKFDDQGNALAVELGVAPPAETTYGQQIYYKFDFAQSSYSLRKTLEVSAAASYAGGSFSASAKASFYRSFKYNKNASYIVFNMRVVNVMKRLLSNCTISEEASELIESGNSPLFYARYGDEYVSGISTGGELTIVLELNFTSEEEKTQFDGEFKVGYGGFGASGSISQALNTKLSTTKVNVRFLKRGGYSNIYRADKDADGKGVGTTSAVNIFNLAEKFPAEVKRNPVQLYATTTDYNSCTGLSKSIPSFFNVKLVLDSIVNLLESNDDIIDNVDLCVRSALAAGCSINGQDGGALQGFGRSLVAIYNDPIGSENNNQDMYKLLADLSAALALVRKEEPTPELGK